MTTIIPALNWEPAGEFSDILYEQAEGIAKITINRPEVRNAFRPVTVTQMRQALQDARANPSIGVILLSGAGDKAFCSGGDQKVRGTSGYRDEGGTEHLNVLDFQREIRTCPKPVIAMVAGYAVANTRLNKRWRWAWSMRSCRWPSWNGRQSAGAGRFWTSRRSPFDV